MSDILFFSAGSAALAPYLPAMHAMIEAEACKLNVANAETYFAPGTDYILALNAGQLVGLCVIKRKTLRHATYLGYALTITKPEARRGGLMGRMVTFYLLRILPQLLWSTVKNLRHKLYIYADISSPVVYAKVSQLKFPLYPDLIHGDSPELRARGAALREDLVTYCDIRNMWQLPGVERRIDFATGLISDHGVAPVSRDAAASRGDELMLDRYWHTRWHDYVPAESDLLVVMPLTPVAVLTQLLHIVKFGFKRQKFAKRRPRPVELLG